MRRGEPLLLFQHRRIREYPISGGVSTCCESMPLDPKLRDWSVALLKAMNWDGVAMVEFRYDEASGRAVLLEVNGRFWGSLPLAVHAGCDFPYEFYRSSVGRTALRRPPRIEPVSSAAFWPRKPSGSYKRSVKNRSRAGAQLRNTCSHFARERGITPGRGTIPGRRGDLPVALVATAGVITRRRRRGWV